jgi:bacterioferritin-associated ferredoxin
MPLTLPLLKTIFSISNPMIVCLCNSVSDAAIARAIDEGASSVREVARRTRAGTCCGACRDSIRDALRASGRSEDRVRVALPILAAFNG